MGRDFRNEFSWSVSRARTFEFCLRQYYWNYYGYWDGWSPEAPELARRAYRLKKMVNLPMWTGDMVHRAVGESLLRVTRRRHVEAEGMKQWARDALNREWRQSTERQWERNAKYNLNLLEHYYEREITAERRGEIRETIFRCLDNFFVCAPYLEAREVGPGCWKPIEELRWFMLGDVKVFVQIDFAYERRGADGADDSLVVVDWKSGKANERDDKQLACYALYAVQEWRTPPERVRLTPVYLNEGEAPERAAEPAALIELRETIFQSAAAMRERLDDVVENAASPEKFPLTEEEWKCRDCPFQELCQR